MPETATLPTCSTAQLTPSETLAFGNCLTTAAGRNHLWTTNNRVAGWIAYLIAGLIGASLLIFLARVRQDGVMDKKLGELCRSIEQRIPLR
jgi:hypothetical protein